MLNPKTRDAILAILVLAVPLILWVAVDDEWLHTLAFIVLGVGVAGVFAARWALGRLHAGTASAGRKALLETTAMTFAASALGAFILLIFMYAD